MAEQNLDSSRTRSERLARRSRMRERGKPSIIMTVLLYALLAGLVIIDYTVLTNAFVLINQAQAQGGGGGSVQGTQALVVIALSFAAVALPHIAAWGFQRQSLGILARQLLWVPWAAVFLWASLLGLVTYIRLVAAATPVIPKEDNTTVPGATPVTPTVPVTGTVDQTQFILAFVMLLVLLVSAVVSYITASIIHNPLRAELHKTANDVSFLDEDLAARTTELEAATAAVGVAAQEPDRDEERYEAALELLESRADALRAEVRTILAASLGSPDATSHLIRELRRHYPHSMPGAARPATSPGARP